MIIVFDIGNTNVSAAVYDGPKLVALMKTRRPKSATGPWWNTIVRKVCSDAGIRPGELTGGALCSVVPAATRVAGRAIRDLTGRTPLIVRGSLPLGLGISYADPDRLGPDRVCGMLAAKDIHGSPVIVVDCGTAVTFDGISRRGRHVGGMIAPGLAASASSLAGAAAALPLVRWSVPKRSAGRSTRDAMTAGVFYSVVGSVRENVRRLKKLTGGDPVVVGTGGDAEILGHAARLFDVIDPTLVLEGAMKAHRKVAKGPARVRATVSRRGAKR